MMDAPRSDAIEAIRRCKKAGIRVVMMTGDYKLTAMAVAREMGILEEGDRALTGEELEKMSDEELVREVTHIRVYARVAPEHKMRIVDAWKKAGHIVAMTGDGVNDAPALKRSNLGVAMGITGTDVAKESADMVLTDDNFASIVSAIEEGRGIYENIRKFVAFLLSANAGEVLVMFIATLALADPQFLPFFSPVQLLWINLVTDGLPALALGVDPYPTDLMARSPRNPKEGVLSRDILFLIVVVAVILTVGTLGGRRPAGPDGRCLVGPDRNPGPRRPDPRGSSGPGARVPTRHGLASRGGTLQRRIERRRRRLIDDRVPAGHDRSGPLRFRCRYGGERHAGAPSRPPRGLFRLRRGPAPSRRRNGRALVPADRLLCPRLPPTVAPTGRSHRHRGTTPRALPSRGRHRRGRRAADTGLVTDRTV